MVMVTCRYPSWLTSILVFARAEGQWTHVLHQQDKHAIQSADKDQHQTRERTKSFEDFFFRFERKIFGSLWRITGDEQIAYDLSQETFLRAWQHFDEIHDRESGAWLFRVAANAAFSYLRRHKKRGEMPLDEDQLDSGDTIAGVPEHDLVMQTLQALTPKQRTVLVLHDVYGLSSAEIGRLLVISPDAIRMALWRAREHFRIHYLKEDEA